MIIGIVASVTSAAGGGGGGGGITEVLYSGFKNGIYRISGSYSTLGAMWEENADYDAFSTSSVVFGTGFGAHYTVGVAPSLTAPAYSALMPSNEGFVVVFTVVQPNNSSAWQIDWRELPLADTDASVQIGKDSIYLQSWDDNDDVFTGDPGDWPAGTNRVAIRFAPDEISLQVEGGVSISTTSPVAGIDFTNVVLNMFDSLGGQTPVVIEEAIFFPVATDLADALAYVPAFVPIAVSDFKGDVYEIAGSAVTVDDIWEEDTNWGSFDAASGISAGVGLTGGSTQSSPRMTATAYASICPANLGFVAVFEVAVPAASSEFGMDFWTSPSFAQDGGIAIRRNWVSAFSPDGVAGDLHNTTGDLPAGFHKIAVRMTPNGVAVKTDNGTFSDAQHTNASPTVNAIAIGFTGEPQATPIVIEKITFYPAALDLDAALAL